MYIKTMLNNLKKVFIFAMVIALSGAALSAAAQQAAGLEDYTAQEQIMIKSFKQEMADMERRQDEITQNTYGVKQQLTDVRKDIDNTEINLLWIKWIQGLIKGIISPLNNFPFRLEWIPLVSTVINTITAALFFITIINIFLYLYYGEKGFYQKYRKKILIAFIIVLFLAFPAFGKEGKTDEPLADKLDRAARLIQMSELEKIIKAMEYRIRGSFTVPELKIDHPYLRPWHEIQIDTPEYYYSLSALYLQNKETGKAIDKLDELIKLKPDRFTGHGDKDRYGSMLINTIHFLIEHKMTGSGSEAVKKAITVIRDVKVLLDLSDFLLDSNMHESGSETLKAASRLINSNDERIDLAGFLLAHQRADEALKVVDESIKLAVTLDELIAALDFSFKNNLSSSIDKGIDKGKKLCRNTEDYIKLAGFLFKNKRKEETTTLLTAARENVRLGQRVEDLNNILEFTMKHRIYEQSLEVIKKLLNILRAKSYTYMLPAPDILDKGLLLDEPVTLPVYSGIINQKIGHNDRAIEDYEKAAAHELDMVIKNYGHKTDINLGSFYYLKELLEDTGEKETLSRLIPLYNVLYKQRLKRLKKTHEQKLASAEEELKGLTGEYNSYKAELEGLIKKKRLSFINLIFQAVRIPAFAAALIFISGGIIVKSIHQAKKVTRFKAFSFTSAFIETLGWLHVLTILSIPLGIFNILAGQLMGMIAHIQQDTEKEVTERHNHKVIDEVSRAA